MHGLQEPQATKGDAEMTPADAWAGEAYVRDEANGCDVALVKFLKRVQRCSDQCARYQFDGSLLWPSIALFTCSRSCQGSPTEDDFAEEEVVLFNE
ncbi:hypothetical protein WJX84_006409 [Apatococcus fuscideae]|uniref:Uncharacterized protein n=1 Tax=Apatococcus fuscideae TaxID=2026836 RepID=A0AAW1RNN2_9CHLO